MKFPTLVAALLGFVCLAAAQEPAVTPIASQNTSKFEPLAGYQARTLELGDQLFGPEAFGAAALFAASDHLHNFPKEWQKSVSGFGKRYASEYGQILIGETIRSGVAALHHEDPRYIRMPGGTFRQRLGHSIMAVVVARKTDGSGSTIALSRFAGVYGSWAIAQRWEPRSATGGGQFLLWGTEGMFTKAAANMIHEFWPDARRKVFTRRGAN